MDTTQKKPDILFIYIDYLYKRFTGLNYHLGAGYIRSFLKQNGILSSQLLSDNQIKLEEIKENILKSNVKIIGFTCFDSNYYTIKIISEKLKKENHNLFIVLGGPTATFSDKFIMNDCKDIDVCIRGEGELTTLELIKKINAGSDILKLAGITLRIKENVIKNPDRNLFENHSNRNSELDYFPSPFLEGIIPPEMAPEIGILTSRGCIYRCTFCNFSIMSRHTIRYHSIDYIINNLKIINNAIKDKKRYIPILDDNFCINIQRAKQVCKRIIKEKLNIKLNYLCSTRIDLMDRELLELLRDANFTLGIGLESAVPRILKEIKKIRSTNNMDENNCRTEKSFLAKFKKNIYLAKKLGLKNFDISAIFGLPGETITDATKTIKFIEKLKVPHYHHNFLQIYTGTEIYKTYKNYNIKLKPSPLLLPFVPKYSFNVDRIPVLKNEIHLKEWDEIKYNFIRIFDGCKYETYKNTVDIIFEDSSLASSSTFGNLKELLSLSSTISFLSNSFSYKFYERDLRCIVNNKLPLVNINYFKKDKLFTKKDYLRYKLLNCDYPFINNISPTNYTFMPFKEFYTLHRLAKNEGEDTGALLLTLNNIKDLDIFFEPQNLEKIPQLIKKNKVAKLSILDGCRWHCKECPAIRLPRIFINRNLDIKTCLTANTIGRLGDSWDVIKKEVINLFEIEKKIRKCRSCPVNNFCSKCIFPFPLTKKEFCYFKRDILHQGVGSLSRKDYVQKLGSIWDKDSGKT